MLGRSAMDHDNQILVFPGNPGANLYAFTILLGAFGSLVFALYSYFTRGDSLFILQGAISILGGYLVGRAVFQRMPSRLEIVEGTVHLYDVPSFWLEFNHFYFPMFCRKRLVIDRARLALEWVDSNLVWNDMEKGRSVFLVSKSEATHVIAWLEQHEFHVPSFPSFSEGDEGTAPGLPGPSAIRRLSRPIPPPPSPLWKASGRPHDPPSVSPMRLRCSSLEDHLWPIWNANGGQREKQGRPHGVRQFLHPSTFRRKGANRKAKRPRSSQGCLW